AGFHAHLRRTGHAGGDSGRHRARQRHRAAPGHRRGLGGRRRRRLSRPGLTLMAVTVPTAAPPCAEMAAPPTRETAMPSWKRTPSLEELNTFRRDCMVGHLGIEITELGEDRLRGTMSVDARTRQPFGLLHGGASVALAESLGSLAAWLCLEDPQRQAAVGLEINANHIR